jgi:hypothetical protein
MTLDEYKSQAAGLGVKIETIPIAGQDALVEFRCTNERGDTAVVRIAKVNYLRPGENVSCMVLKNLSNVPSVEVLNG